MDLVKKNIVANSTLSSTDVDRMFDLPAIPLPEKN
jgi:hypothetical protein